MPVKTNISNTNSISFNQIATQASIGLSNVSMTQLASAYTGVDDVSPIAICEFYSNGCAGAPPTLYSMELYYGPNATVACNPFSEANIFYVDSPDWIDVTKIYIDDAGVTYASSQYYAEISAGSWKQWSSTGSVLNSGVCLNPI